MQFAQRKTIFVEGIRAMPCAINIYEHSCGKLLFYRFHFSGSREDVG